MMDAPPAPATPHVRQDDESQGGLMIGRAYGGGKFKHAIAPPRVPTWRRLLVIIMTSKQEHNPPGQVSHAYSSNFCTTTRSNRNSTSTCCMCSPCFARQAHPSLGKALVNVDLRVAETRQGGVNQKRVARLCVWVAQQRLFCSPPRSVARRQQVISYFVSHLDSRSS